MGQGFDATVFFLQFLHHAAALGCWGLFFIAAAEMELQGFELSFLAMILPSFA